VIAGSSGVCRSARWSYTAERFLRVLDSLLASDGGQDTRAR
jgi:hypothetical protein